MTNIYKIFLYRQRHNKQERDNIFILPFSVTKCQFFVLQIENIQNRQLLGYVSKIVEFLIC